MATVICPECGKECSEYSNVCVDCGFPIKQFMEDNKLSDTRKVFMCPQCAFYSGGGLSKVYIKCKYCNMSVIQLDIDRIELEKELYKIYKSGDNEYDASFLKKDNRNQFSQEAYENRRHIVVEKNNKKLAEKQEASNIPKCPKCGSTAISLVSDVRGRSLVWTKMINCCANCGYKWTPGKKHLSWF